MTSKGAKTVGGKHRSFLADMPIQRKLMVISMSVTGAALLLSGFGLVVLDVVFFVNSLRSDLSGLARITAENSTAALTFDDPRAATETLSALRARTHVVTACIYGALGNPFARYQRVGTDTACPAPRDQETIAYSFGGVNVSLPILLTHRRIGTLVLLYDLDELYTRMRLFGTTVLLMLLASALVALFLSSRVQRIVATPILELARATAAVSSTKDYGIRAAKLTNDELGLLVDGFNDMLAGIQTRDQDLRRALLARESALKDAAEARDFLRTTLASIGDAVVSADQEGKIVFANPVACSLMRYAEEEIIGRPLSAVLLLVNEKTRDTVESPVSRVLEQGVIVGLANHTVLIASDGTEVPIDDSAAPIRGSHGGLIGVVLIFRDITERRRSERELHSAREQLQLVTDTMAPAVTHCSGQRKFIWVSRRYAEWLQLEREEINGRMMVDVLGQDVYSTVEPYIDRLLRGERVEYEAQAVFPKIGRRWFRAVSVPTRDPNGVVDGWVSDISDITALKSAEAEVVRINADLQRSNERLARSNEDLAQFAYAASHDLQEPLRMIIAYAQLLSRNYGHQVQGEGAGFVRNILEGSVRMRTLLADLLAYSEIGGDSDQSRNRVDLNAIVETVRQNLRVALEETGAAVTVDHLPVITAHAGHFVQLFQNLLNNAIKYRSDQPPRIRISCERIDGDLRFAVADNGIGIDPEYHTKIFGVFKRLHGKSIPGTGIGLAICQRVVERYNGRIWVDSQPGLGATFFFTLPEYLAASEGGNDDSKT